MNKRVVAPSAGLQRSNLAQPGIIDVVDFSRDQSISEPSDNQNAKADLPSVADANAAPGASQVANGEQFAQLPPAMNSQSTSSDDDKILASGAHFNDPFIDPLLDGLMESLPHGTLSPGLSGDAREDAGAGLGIPWPTLGAQRHPSRYSARRRRPLL